MTEELFEKYCRNELTAEEAAELKRMLREDAPAGAAFTRYVQERSILVQLTARQAGEGRLSGDSDRPSRGAGTRVRRMRRASGSGAWTPFIVAAAVLVAFILGLMLLPSGAPPAPPSGPTAKAPEAPKPAPKEVPVAPVVRPTPKVPVPVPVPTRPRDTRPPVTRPALPERPAPAVARKPEEPAKPEPPKSVTPAPKTVPAVASIGAIQGKAEIVVAGRPARRGQAILAGQRVEVRGESGSGVLSFPDGTRFTLSAPTLLGELTEENGKRITLTKGSILAEVRKQAAGAPMVFTTPHGKATVLGTTLRLSVGSLEASEGTRLEVTEGRVRLTRNDGENVLVRAAQYAVASPGTRLVARRMTPPAVAFDALPKWSGTYDADWGSAATWRLAEGVSGRGLRVSRASAGSSVRVLVFNVPANSEVEISAFLKCPEFNGDYWVELGMRLGGHGAADFDVRPQSWTVLQKFGQGEENGNQDRWVRYAQTLRTGNYRQVTLGFKVGSRVGGGPVAGIDDIRITPQ